jgi:hypothetical protein
VVHSHPAVEVAGTVGPTPVQSVMEKRQLTREPLAKTGMLIRKPAGDSLDVGDV